MNRKLRNAIIQSVFMAGLVLVIGGSIVTAQQNLQAQGITSGFGFLERGTGWDMGFAFLPFSISDPYWWTLLMGLMNTVIVGYIALALATVIGVVLAAMRISGNPVLNGVALAWVEVIRNVPPILQVLVWYGVFTAFPAPREAIELGGGVFVSARGVFLPALNIDALGAALVVGLLLVAIGLLIWIAFGRRFMFAQLQRKTMLAAAVVAGAAVGVVLLTVIFRTPDAPLFTYPELRGFNFRGGVSIPPELTTILVGTMVFGSAYVAEIVRGGFLSVDPGKIEAGRALGMSGWMVFSRIQLPITIKNILPMMTNLYVWLIKATTLGIAVGFSDLFAVTVSSINQSGQTLEFIFIAAAAFWALNTAVAWTMHGFEKRLQRREAR